FSDGGSPANWDHACTINTTREFTLDGSASEATAPNCDNLDAPDWVLRTIDTLSAGISGAGTMDPPSYGTLRDKMLAGESFPVRVVVGGTGAQGGGYYQGNYVMTSLGGAKAGKGYLTSTVAMSSDGEITWTDAD
ncbi:MAG: hypothetical protein JWR80_162, partial [Bradyrhizobium sp.]|nr:hypothetical protein [Bradyrhizobium sp.]